jgi:hypothetical protein
MTALEKFNDERVELFLVAPILPGIKFPYAGDRSNPISSFGDLALGIC